MAISCSLSYPFPALIKITGKGKEYVKKLKVEILKSVGRKTIVIKARVKEIVRIVTDN